MARASQKSPPAPHKLTRAHMLDYVKQQRPELDFIKPVQDLSLDDLAYLATLGERLHGYYHRAYVEKFRQAGASDYLAKGIYEYLAAHKELVYVIYGDYGSGPQLLTTEVTVKDLNENLRQYRRNSPEGRYSYKRRYVTARQLEKL